MSRLYTIELYSPSGERLADISDLCLTRTYQVRRNRPEDIYLTLSLEKAQELAQSLGMNFYQLFAARITEVRITRGSRTLVGGKLMVVHPRLNQVEDPTLELRASGFLSLLSRVYLEDTDTSLLNWTATDVGAVAWGLIEGIQAKTNGNFGFTQGTIQTSRTIGETYQPYGSSIAEMLVGLTDRQDGIDFEITADKQFNVYYPGIGTTKDDLLFTYPGNVTAIGVPQDATNLTNIAFARGSGFGLSQSEGAYTNTDSGATYGRAESVEVYPSIKETDTLDDKAQEEVELYGVPTTIPAVRLDGSQEPFLGAYWIGDRVRFAVDTQRYPAFGLISSQQWRINEITCDISDTDREDITVKVGYR